VRCSSNTQTLLVDGMSVGAIAAQDAFLHESQAQGHRLVGYKIALLDPQERARLGAAGPAWGQLTDDMALVDGAEFGLSGVASAKAEVELVFQLGDDLVGPGVTEADALAATWALHVGIEISAVPVGSQAAADVETFTSQNTFASNYIVGRAVTDFTRVDMSLVGAIVEVDGNVVSSGCGARVLGSPARAVAWLANGLAVHGKELHAGMLVFTGALADPVTLTVGRRVSVEIAHLGRAAISAA
jgi:2-oxo-3-hexenedioate decarboxylase